MCLAMPLSACVCHRVLGPRLLVSLTVQRLSRHWLALTARFCRRRPGLRAQTAAKPALRVRRRRSVPVREGPEVRRAPRAAAARTLARRFLLAPGGSMLSVRRRGAQGGEEAAEGRRGGRRGQGHRHEQAAHQVRVARGQARPVRRVRPVPGRRAHPALPAQAPGCAAAPPPQLGVCLVPHMGVDALTCQQRILPHCPGS